MKAYGKTNQGYCCEWCDGPYRKWVKKTRKYQKKQARQQGKKEIKNAISDPSKLH